MSIEQGAYPELSVEDIEASADRLLTEFFTTEGTEVTVPVPVEAIAEHHLGYVIDITDEGLFSDPDYLGGILFDESVIRVNAAVEKHEGRYNFTIAHEIGHHMLHRDVFIATRQDSDEILCRETGEKPQIEREADRFAAALLMPELIVARAVSEIELPNGASGVRQHRILAARVSQLGGFNNVSNTAMLNRLIDLSYLKEVDYQSGRSADFWRHARRNTLLSRAYRWFYSRLKLIPRGSRDR